MRLIDADKIYPDSVSIKGNRLCISQSQLAEAPTIYDSKHSNNDTYTFTCAPKDVICEIIGAIPVENIEKELEIQIRTCYEMFNGDMSGSHEYKYRAQGLQKAQDIIKHLRG